MSPPASSRSTPSDRYVELLQAWGARMNLTGSTDPEALRAHVEEGRAAASAFPRGARVADLGSGAGLPGIPIAIERPDLAMVLVEIRERRVSFLRHAIRELGLEVEVRRTRLEEPPLDPFDIALARAVAPPAEIFPLARPWIRPDGELWLWTHLAAQEIPGATEMPLAPGRGRILRIPATRLI